MFLYGLAEELKTEERRPTMFALEQPEDPARYRKDADVKEYMSMFRTIRSGRILRRKAWYQDGALRSGKDWS